MTGCRGGLAASSFDGGVRPQQHRRQQTQCFRGDDLVPLSRVMVVCLLHGDPFFGFFPGDFLGPPHHADDPQEGKFPSAAPRAPREVRRLF